MSPAEQFHALFDPNQILRNYMAAQQLETPKPSARGIFRGYPYSLTKVKGQWVCESAGLLHGAPLGCLAVMGLHEDLSDFNADMEKALSKIKPLERI